MAIVALPGALWITGLDMIMAGPSTDAVQDATGESVALIGYVNLEGFTGSKTCSAAGGGAILTLSDTAGTFANAGSTLRIGLQDVDTATGLEDGTFDVHADLVGGTDTIAAVTYMRTPMESGSKTLSQGQLVAIVWELVSRGGADTIQTERFLAPNPSPMGLDIPYGTADTGAGPAKSISAPLFFIEFDDGTLGWIQGTGLGSAYDLQDALITFASDSDPDEYIATFTPNVPMQISAIGCIAGDIDPGAATEVILYSDPYGTPVAEQTATIDPEVVAVASGGPSMVIVPITPETLVAGTTYGVALRPTTTGSIQWGYIDIGSGNDALKGATPFGTTFKMAERTDQTGAFSETQVYHVPGLFLQITGLDDGTGGGGGGGFHSGMSGGMQ